jgi:mono/diheme cytochrome c family protein
MRVRFAFALSGGCVAVALLGVSAGAQAPSLAATPTFSKDVAPILYKNCVSCHRPGEMGPMSLLTYDQARPYMRAIRAKVADGAMPPWHAVAPAGTFLNERQLSEAERDTIAAWASNGGPQGDPKDLPPAPQFAQGWTIGQPDAVVSMTSEYSVAASGTIDYQYFEMPTNFTEDKWVQAIEIRSGATQVVHHILVYARDPSGSQRPSPFAMLPVTNPAPPRPEDAARFAAAAERQRSQGGQQQIAGSPSVNRGVLIATTAPGTNAVTFEPGTAMLVKAGSILTFQVHYTANGTTYQDRSSVGFVFAKQPAQKEIRSSAFVNARFALAPGAADQKVESAIEFNEASHIWALFPHTHLRGKSWEYRLVYADGRSEVVLSVPKYDFNWQTYYQYAKPLAAPKGSRLEAVAVYDNSSGNRANPDPSVEVRWGEQTWEEMQYSGITFTVDAQGTTTQQP